MLFPEYVHHFAERGLPVLPSRVYRIRSPYPHYAVIGTSVESGREVILHIDSDKARAIRIYVKDPAHRASYRSLRVVKSVVSEPAF